MGDIEFLAILNDNIGVYFLSLFISFFPILYLLRITYISFVDPLFYQIVMAGFANTVPLFLFIVGEIEPNYFVYFVLAESFFWGGFMLGLKKRINENKKILVNEQLFAKIMYSIFFVAICVLNVSTYFFWGIPAFSESRNETFVGSGGWGAISHLTPFMMFYCVFYSFYLIHIGRVKFVAYTVFFCIAMFCILSGSRSSLLIFASSYFTYNYFYLNKLPSKRVVKLIMIIAISGAMLIFSFSVSQGGLIGALLAFVYRVVGNGDIYWLAFPNEMITGVDSSPWYIDLFYSPLYSLRILDYADSKPLIGYQLVVLNNYGRAAYTAIGANIRPPVYGYYHFGWGGLIFSFIIGYLVAFGVKNIVRMFPKGILGISMGAFFYIQIMAMFIDPPLGIAFIFDAVLGGGLLLFIFMFIAFVCAFFSKTSNELT